MFPALEDEHITDAECIFENKHRLLWSIFMQIAITQWHYTHTFDVFPNNKLVETCCDRTKIVCCWHPRRRSDDNLAAHLTITIRDRSVGTHCDNLLISPDLLQVVLPDLLILVSNRFVAVCWNKPLRLCQLQLATDLSPQACYSLTKWTSLLLHVNSLRQLGKINSLHQVCDISGCVPITYFIYRPKFRRCGRMALQCCICLFLTTTQAYKSKHKRNNKEKNRYAKAYMCLLWLASKKRWM